MTWLRHLTLHLLLFCCCDLPTPGCRRSWISGTNADDSSEEVIYKVTVDLSSSVHEIGGKFLSVAFPAKYTPVPWTQKMLNLASALYPADIRVLGKINTFCLDEKVEPADTKRQLPGSSDQRVSCKKPENQEDFILRETKCESSSAARWINSNNNNNDTSSLRNMKRYSAGSHWQIFNANVAKVGWNLLLGFENVRRKADGSWNSSLAEVLLNYSSSKGIPIRYFHLGNEPNLYPVSIGLTITPKILVDDYRALRRLLSKYPLYAASKLYGPDVTTLDKHSTARTYLTQFLEAGAETVVDAISLHHYYCKSNASMVEFLSPLSLESLRSSLEIGKRLVQAKPNALPLILSETSSCSGGGTPNLSDRYISGILWLDKLGLSALYGVTQLFRQSLYSGASYSLVLGMNTTVQPDYYLSVLYKRLVQGPVFKVNLNPPNQKLRVYANCASQELYTPGDLVIYYVNLEETNVVLLFDQFPNVGLDLYMLTHGDSEGVKSRDVKLNGETLQMAGSELPPLLPKQHSNAEVQIAAQSFGFVVVPGAYIAQCSQYFTRVAMERASNK